MIRTSAARKNNNFRAEPKDADMNPDLNEN